MPFHPEVVRMTQEDRGLVSRIGPIEVDWPRSIGFFGAVGVATAVGLLEPPLGAFIAAVPFLKMLNRPQLPTPTRFLSQILDGMAKPVGGDAEGTIRFSGQANSASRAAAASRATPTSSRTTRSRAQSDGRTSDRNRATSNPRRAAR